MKKHTYSLILIILSIVVYANTLGHDYALDDALVLTQNSFTKQGIDGIDDIFTNEFFTGFFGQQKNLVAGGRYRPLSMAMFAIEYELFGLNPFIGHFINVLLYALTVLLFFKLLQWMLPENKGNWYTDIAFISALLFAAHPLHTEVVANIKGRDEILALLSALGTLYLSSQYVLSQGKEKLAWFAASFSVFLVGLFSKENGITFLAAVPFILYYFKGQTMKKSLSALVPLLAASAVFLYVRMQVLGTVTAPPATELMNDPFLGTTVAQKFATVFYTWFLYAKLMVFPHPLTYDYYPFHIAITDFANPLVWLGLLLFAGVAAIAFSYFIRSLKDAGALPAHQKNYVLSAIIFFASFSVVSNLLFPIGAFMNERFLYFPTVGLALAAGTAFVQLQNKYGQQWLRYSLIAVLLAFSVKTMSRNTAWKDDFTLFTTDVKTSYNSAKSTCSAGGKLLERAKDNKYADKRDEYLALSKEYLLQSLNIYPDYVEALLLLGNCYFEYEQYDSTIYYYRQLVARAPNHKKVYDNLQVVLTKIDDVDKKLEICHDFHKVNSVNYDLNYNLGVLYGKHKGNLQQSIFYLERAVKIDKTRKEALKDLGVAYGMARRPQDAEKILKLAIKSDPEDAQTYLNLGVTYQGMGRMEEAKQYFAKALELDPSLGK